MSRPGMPRLATSKTRESSGIRARPKAEAISRVIVRSTARRLPSTARDQAKHDEKRERDGEDHGQGDAERAETSRNAAETAAHAATAA